jgi:S1-C subfamily serine protease
MRITTGAALLLALASAAAGCRHRDQWVPRDRTPGVDGEPAGPPPQGATKAWYSFDPAAGVAGAGQAALAEFVQKTALAPRTASIGFLPLVMYDSDHRGPWVPELGVSLADEAAGSLRTAGFQGLVLDSTGMSVRLHQVNLDKVSLSTLEGISDAGDRLGVDVAVFGVMRRDKDPGTPFLQVIRVDLTAYGFLAGTVLARAKFELRSDDGQNKPAYAAARNESLWMPGTAWEVPPSKRAFDEELRIVADMLAKRVVQTVDLEKAEGSIYVPPADTGRFVRSIARLRAAQGAFVLELEKRTKEAARGEDPLAVEKPLTLNGVEFKTLQAAHSYLSTLREQLLATETARFAGTVSSLFAEALRPIVSPRKVILEVGFTEASDVSLLEGELATGGLVRSLRSRQALQAKGVALVVAPRVERVGSNYALRAEVYDLGKPNLVASASVRVDQRYAADLAKMLEVDELAAVDDLPAVERASWDKVYDQVASGGVVLTGKKGEGVVQGSGFVVSSEGLVMTNSHVVAGIEAGSGTATFAGGKSAPFKVVRDDPFWDVAIVRVDGLPEGTHVFRFAEGDRVKVGAEVAVLGAPKGTSGWVFTPGHISSTREMVQTSGHRPSLMYTCATRAGSSGSPVLLEDGSVVAVHSAGTMGDVKDSNGYQVVSGEAVVFAELPGFALGAPGPEARRILEGGAGTAR